MPCYSPVVLLRPTHVTPLPESEMAGIEMSFLTGLILHFKQERP
jgi:hypothetical protein